MIYEGWKSFEETCSQVGLGELPQLLRYLKTATTPTPTLTKMEPKEETEQMEEEEASTSGTSGELIEKPIHISVGGKTKMYKCRNCDITPKCSRMGMDSSISAVHTNKALVCSFCPFSCQLSRNVKRQTHNGLSSTGRQNRSNVSVSAMYLQCICNVSVSAGLGTIL